MTRFLALAAALLAAACNPARVDPPPSADKAETRAAAPAAQANAQSPEPEPRPGSDFAAIGQVRCVTRAGWAWRDCSAGVVRGRDGSAAITIFHPEGRSRTVAFDARGRATGVATAEEDGSDRQPFAASRRGNLTLVTLGPERYEIPDAMVRGD